VNVDQESVAAWIRAAFDPLEEVVSDGNSFFFFDPDHLFPSATIVTSDLYEAASDLGRPGIDRLNVGVRG
jgi:hypothetical protein